MTTEDDIEFPQDDRKSRINRPPKADTPEDVTSAADRIEAFWQKYPGGSILPEVDSRIMETPDGPCTVYTVRAFIRKDSQSESPDSVAHATRGENDPDPLVAQYPQETAETSAISRAIRNLGILAGSTKTPAPAPVAVSKPQSDAEVGRSVATARDAAGVSQAELAASMTDRGFKWSQATVYNVEKGKRPVRFNEAQHLAEIIQFGVPT